jgi:hypothetical protein
MIFPSRSAARPASIVRTISAVVVDDKLGIRPSHPSRSPTSTGRPIFLRTLAAFFATSGTRQCWSQICVSIAVAASTSFCLIFSFAAASVLLAASSRLSSSASRSFSTGAAGTGFPSGATRPITAAFSSTSTTPEPSSGISYFVRTDTLSGVTMANATQRAERTDSVLDVSRLDSLASAAEEGNQKTPRAPPGTTSLGPTTVQGT